LRKIEFCEKWDDNYGNFGNYMTLKENIIHEALRLYSLKGFLGTTIDDILTASKASKGGFYNHFKSKEDLFHHVLKEARGIWRQRNLTGLGEDRRPIENVIRFLENFRDDYLEDSENFPGGCIFIRLLIELKDQSPHLAKEIQQGFLGLKEMIHRYLSLALDAGELRKNVDVVALTEIIFHGTLGATITHNAGGSDSSGNASIDYLIDYIKEAGN
jgi:TetR/AcrR family transcriptional regulator, transcriptional repressor for nem operon